MQLFDNDSCHEMPPSGRLSSDRRTSCLSAASIWSCSSGTTRYSASHLQPTAAVEVPCCSCAPGGLRREVDRPGVGNASASYAEALHAAPRAQLRRLCPLVALAAALSRGPEYRLERQGPAVGGHHQRHPLSAPVCALGEAAQGIGPELPARHSFGRQLAAHRCKLESASMSCGGVLEPAGGSATRCILTSNVLSRWATCGGRRGRGALGVHSLPQELKDGGPAEVPVHAPAGPIADRQHAEHGWVSH